MSDALPGDALDPAPAASPDDAPGGGGSTVEEGSAGGEEPTVPASRFNGLMSKYQSEKAEWDKRFEAMQAELERLRNDKEKTPVATDDGTVQELREQIETLTQALASQHLEAARREALEKYPAAKPLADLIVGNSKEEIFDVARVISERLETASGATENPVVTQGEEETPQKGAQLAGDDGEGSTEPPVVGGAVSNPDGLETLRERVNSALEKGSWSEYFRAKQELTQLEAGLSL